jgi:hypothetical protein
MTSFVRRGEIIIIIKTWGNNNKEKITFFFALMSNICAPVIVSRIEGEETKLMRTLTGEKENE